MSQIPIIIDIEASGFGGGSYPIEVGIAMSDDKAFCCLIKPEPQWEKWDEDSEKVHGIGRDVLQRNGKPAIEVAEKLNELLKFNTVYTDAWGHDYSWLSTLFFQTNVKQQFKLEPLTAIMSEYQLSNWHKAKDAVTEEMGLQRHRASSDAKILQITYLRTRLTQH